MGTFFHILKYKFIAFVKSTFEPRFVTAVRGVGSLLVFGGFAAVAYFFSLGLTRFVLDETRIGLFLYHRFISMLLFVFFMSVNLGNVIVSYATLYKSSEVGYLLTKPVPYTQIFTLKFLDNFLYSSTTLFLVALMVLLGYGTYFGHPWYLLLGVLVFVLVPFMFLSACIAVLVLMSVVKVASKWGFRKVMTGLAVLYFGIVVLFFQFSNPIRQVQEVNAHGVNVDAYFRGLESGILSYLPNTWVSDVLYFMARGETNLALLSAVQLLALTLAVFMVVLFVADRFYFKSWLATFEFQARSNTVESGKRIKLFDFRKSSFLSPQMESLMKKEYFQFFREASQWVHLGVMVVLVGVFAISVGNLNPTLRVTEIQTLTYLVLYAFGGFLSCSLALRFVFPAISLEGRAFWSQLSAPVDLRKVYVVKFVIGFLVVLLLALLVAIFSNEPFVRLTQARPVLMYFGIFSAFWVSITLVALNLGLGGYFANFQEKNPIRVASSQGATLTFLVSLVYLFVLVSVVIVPLSQYFQSLFLFFPFDMRSIVVPGTLVGALSAALTGFAIVVGLRSLARDF
jgi:ABC-2 type transport system permease protein